MTVGGQTRKDRTQILVTMISLAIGLISAISMFFMFIYNFYAGE